MRLLAGICVLTVIGFAGTLAAKQGDWSSVEQELRSKVSPEGKPVDGWYLLRNGWQQSDNYLLFDARPVPPRSEPSMLSFQVYAGGQWQVISPPFNTVRVDEQSQVVPTPTDPAATQPANIGTVWQSTNRFDLVAGTYSAGFGPEGKLEVGHTRAILLVKPNLWLVADTMDPKDKKPHRYEALFHLGKGEPRLDSDTQAVSVPSSDGTFFLQTISERPVKGHLAKFEGGHKAVYQVDADGPFTMITVMAQLGKGEQSPQVAVLPMRDDRSGAAVDVRMGEKHLQFLARRSDGTICRFGELLTDGRWVLAQLNDKGEIMHRLIYGGLLLQPQPKPQTQPQSAPATAPAEK